MKREVIGFVAVLVVASACGKSTTKQRTEEPGTSPSEQAEPAPAHEAAPAPAAKQEPELEIRRVTPKEGSAAGGQRVTITGLGFQAAGSASLDVLFGKTKGRVVTFEDDQIVVESPPGEAGTVVDLKIWFGGARMLQVEGAHRYTE